MAATEDWQKYKRAHVMGELIPICISKLTDFGLLAILEPGIVGIVHMQDIDWDVTGIEVLKGFSVGDTIDTLVLSVEPEKGRVCLGIKQINRRPDRDPSETSPEHPRPVWPGSPGSPVCGSEAAKEIQGSKST